VTEATARAAAGVLAAILLTAVAAAADDLSFDRDQEVTIDAREISYDQKRDTVSAVGDVEIRHGDTVLRAERVEVNRTTQDAAAVGGAVLTNPSVTIRASEMEINLLDETGTLRDVEMRSETMGYSLWGEVIEKQEGQRYRIEKGLFTTCQCDDPDDRLPWSVSGDSLEVDLGGDGEVRGARFLINDVPVLYIPRAVFPASNERQTGLLFPRLGISNRRGLQILQPFYWTVSKSQDVTLSFDIETAQRLGLVAEHRYAIDRRSSGEMQVMYFNESIRGKADEVSIPGAEDVDVPENRWGVIGQHAYAFGDSELYADMLLVGDDVFLREINTFTLDDAEDVTLRTRPFTSTRAGGIHSWSRGYGQIEGVFHQNLVGREAYVLQNAPRGVAVAQKQIGGGLLGSVDASVVNFERSTGITGTRIDLAPRLELRVPLGPSVDGSLSTTLRETAYVLTQDQMFGGFNGEATGAEANTLIDLPGTSSREAIEVRGRLATGLSRVFDFSRWGLTKLKHTIEPQAEYLYVPSIDQEDQPIFDGDDRLAARNVFSYGFASRLLGKRPGRAAAGAADSAVDGDTVFELARVALVQSYDVRDEIPQAGESIDRKSFSDFDFSLRLFAGPSTSLRFASTYDPTRADLTSTTVALVMREPEWLFPDVASLRVLRRSRFGVEYRFIADNSVPGTSAVEQLDSSVLLRVTERVGLRYSGRFNIAANRLLSNFFGLSYLSACDCWSVDLGVSDKSNPNEVQLQAQVSLLGFGSTEGGSRAGLAE
jgi:LPS-assembly protein